MVPGVGVQSTLEIIIIIKQLLSQHMSIKIGDESELCLTNRSCGPATAVSDGKLYSIDEFLVRI